MVVSTGTRHLLCLILIIVVIVSYSILTQSEVKSSQEYNEESSVKSLKTNQLKSVEHRILDQERKMESLRGRIEDIKGDIDHMGSRQKRSLQSDLTKCPDKSPHLRGSLIVNEDPRTMSEVEARLEDRGILSGGRHSPSSCRPAQRTAFIIPYRDRASHLALWISHLHPILARQQLDYQIFLVEQVDTYPFNRGALLNIGILEAGKQGEFSCYVLHDVDMVPESDLALYQCPPSHQIFTFWNTFSLEFRWRYRLSYPQYLGGIILASNQTIHSINGFSNSFYGWGGEDDDFYCRVVRNNITINRYPGSVARFRMLRHAKVEENPLLKEMDQLSKNRQLDKDGLNNVKYTVLDIKMEKLLTRIRVKLGPPPLGRQKGWFERLTDSIEQAQNRIANKLAEKINQFTEGDEQPDRLKIYY